jgi:ankyrin repeat protein
MAQPLPKHLRRLAAILALGLALAPLTASAAGKGEALLQAVRSGDRASALALLGDRDARGFVDAADDDGTRALHWAVHANDEALVRALIARGADASRANDYGATPLSEAAIAAHEPIVRALVEAGAKVDARNAEGQTALMVVARTDRVDTARYLLRKGADVNARERWRNQTALMWAAEQKQPAMVRLLLEHGADPNARSTVNDWQRQVTLERRGQWRPIGGMTPLLFAAREGCLGCVEALLDHGADPNLPDPENVTPMLVAAINYTFDIVARLLERGGNPNKWDWRGRTPLYAVVDLNTIPHGGRPELPSADATTSLALIDRLLAAGAFPNVQLKLMPPYRDLKDDRGADNVLTIGSTPLLRAAKAFDLPAMQRLIAAGARPDLPNVDGITPLMLAAGLAATPIDTRGTYTVPDVQQRSIAALTLLLDAGADVNRRNAQGQTALFGAVYWGWDEVARFLVKRGARLDVKDAQGKTLLDAALGRAAHGRGRGSQGEDPHPSTAEMLRELIHDSAAQRG